MKNDRCLQSRKTHLEERKKTKQEILRAGGEQSLSHSWRDIVRINFALKRIETGQYGLCCDCGCLIDPRRLDVIPETPLCTPCAEKINH